MFGKPIWKNVVILDNAKDAILVSTKEKLGINPDFEDDDIYPVTVELPKGRSYISAIRRSVEFSKMGIFNLICRQTL